MIPAAKSQPSPGGRRLRIDSRRRWIPDFGDPLRAGQLLLLLSRRDITVKYRQTVLGTIWIFVSPVASAGLFTFVFGTVAKLESDGTPYFLFSYTGLLAWNLFADTLGGTSRSLTANAGLLSKIYFPRLVLPLSSLASTLLNGAISLVILIALLVGYDVGFTARMLVFPIWLFLAISLAMGIGLVLTAISVTHRDINYLTPTLVPLLLYLTPVAYATSAVPASLQPVYRLNPMATIVEGFRWSILGHGHLPLWTVAYTASFTAVAIAVGLMVFARLEWNFADVI